MTEVSPLGLCLHDLNSAEEISCIVIYILFYKLAQILFKYMFITIH
jgi:uncharacterized membrane protein YhdT